MSEPDNRPRKRWRVRLGYLATILLTAVVTFLLVALLMNITERKREARDHYLKLVELTEDTVDPAVWGQNFPRQYDGYRRTAENTSRRHGGSEAISKLDEDPRLRRIFAGYPFSVDRSEERRVGKEGRTGGARAHCKQEATAPQISRQRTVA